MSTIAPPLADAQTKPGVDAGSTAGGAPASPPAPALPDDERLAELAEELDRIRAEVLDSLGAEDAAYIRRVIRAQRALEAAGRVTLMGSAVPFAWVAGTAMLTTAKILENMEIGHNVMHGQWDWMRDPAIASTTWEWDNVCPAAQWQHSHNQVHHVWTNVAGRDPDLGYGILRVGDHQPWTRSALFQPIYAALLALVFEWGVALHDVDLDRLRRGKDLPPSPWDPDYERTRTAALERLAQIRRKATRQILKDYVVFPLLAGPAFVPVLAANLTANTVRNLWAFAVIFCGHFPDGAEHFPDDGIDEESKGAWCARQILGSANISGGPVLDLFTGNLSHQIEHHLYPDMPSNRYARIAPRVRAACERAGLPYNTGSMARQFGSVIRRIVRYALPG